jgi:hypothetical protein
MDDKINLYFDSKTLTEEMFDDFIELLVILSKDLKLRFNVYYGTQTYHIKTMFNGKIIQFNSDYDMNKKYSIYFKNSTDPIDNDIKYRHLLEYDNTNIDKFMIDVFVLVSLLKGISNGLQQQRYAFTRNNGKSKLHGQNKN